MNAAAFCPAYLLLPGDRLQGDDQVLHVASVVPEPDPVRPMVAVTTKDAKGKHLVVRLDQMQPVRFAPGRTR